MATTETTTARYAVAEGAAPAVEYIDLFKTFDYPVLAGVNLEVARGEVLAVVGHSGTGKSVLLKTTIGLITPDDGDVRIDGQSVFDSDAKVLYALRRKVGYVFQNAALFDSMTVYENVAQGLSEGELRELGRARVGAFRWTVAAEATLDLYRRLRG